MFRFNQRQSVDRRLMRLFQIRFWREEETVFCGRRLRNVSVIITLVCVALVGVVSGCSNNNTPQKLSELDEDKLILLLADHEIMIPENLETSAIQNVIADLEVDPDRPAPVVSWTGFLDFYEELRIFVKEYYSMIP